MKKNLIIDEHITRDEVLVDSLDAFYSEAPKTYVASGHHIVKLINWELVPEREVETRTDHYITKSYVLLDLKDIKTGEVTTTRLYSNFTPFFIDQIAAQTDGAISGMKLSKIFEYLGKHDFDIWVSYSKQYGVQVNYQEPRN